MSQLAGLIDSHAQELLERWTRQVDAKLVRGARTDAELRDHVPVVLQELVLALRQGVAPESSDAGREHGRQRHRLGFNLEVLVREYGLLRGLILDLTRERAAAVDFNELRVLSDFFATAVAEGVAAYSRQREQAESDLHSRSREQEASLAITLSSIGDAVIATDVQGRITFVNPVAEALTGWSRDEARGVLLTQVFRIISETNRAEVESPVARVLAKGTVQGLANHTLLIRKDGSEIPIDDSAAPIRDAAGALSGVVLVFRDVTEKKQAEAVLEAAHAEADREREKLNSLFMQAPVGICMLEGPRHVFTFANPRYRELVNGRDIVGKPLLEALPDVRNDGFDKFMDQVVATGVPFAGKEVVVRLDHHRGDERLIVNFVYQPKRNAKGEIDGILAIVIDVTEQVEARQKTEALAAALARNEEYLRLVIESSGAATFALDLATGVMSVDARYRELAGLTADEPVTRERRLAIIHPEDSPRVAERLREAAALTTGGRYQVEYRTAELPDGGRRWVQSTGKVKDGTIFGINVDVTPQKRAEEERERLLASVESERQKLRSLFLNAPAFLALLRGPEHVFELFNEPYQRLVGVGRKLQDLPVAQALPEVVPQGFVGLLDAVYETGKPFITAEIFARLDRRGAGELEDAWLNFVYEAVRNAAGEIEGIVVFGFDITEQVVARRQLERLASQLQQSEERLRLVVASSGMGTFSFDAATQQVDADERFRALFGFPPGEPFSLEKGLATIHPDDSPSVSKAVADAMAGLNGGIYFAEYRTPAEDGYRWVEARGKVVFSANGRPAMMFGTGLDITARKQAEQTRARLLEEAKQRSLFDQQILGIVSHDLRNPLTAISYSAATLSRRESLDERSRKSAERIQSSAQRAGRMVSDLLDFTQARLGGGIRVARKDADLAEIARAVLAEMEAAHPARKPVLQVSGGVLGKWDPDRLAQVVQNLVGNALSYSPAESEVSVEIRGVGQEARLSVHNTGAPISPEVLGRLFEPMQRGTAASDQTRSVGLGLYIVKALVEAHEGRVEVHSTAETGTTFTVHLPRGA
ncbi:MAG TPA: PAS domain S-box protein [Myxococcales bacterium]|nr:PAS domain S-box protein [Myxococcales bacterium]